MYQPLLALVLALGLSSAQYESENGVAVSVPADWSEDHENSLLSAMLATAAADYATVTDNPNWSAYESALPSGEASDILVLATTNPTDAAWQGAAEDFEYYPTTAPDVAPSVTQFVAQVASDVACDQIRVVTQAGGIATVTGLACPQNAAAPGTGNAWAMSLMVAVAGAVAGAALIL